MTVSVELPEPDAIAVDDYHWWDSNSVYAHPGDGVGYLDGVEMTVSELKELAGQLLAAAAVAERRLSDDADGDPADPS